MNQSFHEVIGPRLERYQQLRRELHAMPELGFDTHNAVSVICRELGELGIPFHQGIGRTGVVGVISGQSQASGRGIGLRADMDALPISERTGLPYASSVCNKMHACGHDGHVTTLLAAADYLQKTRNFDGSVYLIFQPGEEGYRGGLEMVNDGLFERFHIERIFALHNWPSLPLGQISVPVGAVMAAGDTFTIHIHGKGGHGGVAPHLAVDPILIAGHIITAIHSIVSRNLDPIESGVVSLGGIAGGDLDAFGVIPEEVTICGTVRSLCPEVQSVIEARLRETVRSISAAFGGSATLEYRNSVPATINAEKEALLARAAAADVVGAANVVSSPIPSLGGEDFAFMLNERPGAYIHVGAGDEEHTHGLHSAYFDFNDRATPIGAALFARIVERSMPLEP